jgi:hypothetical protein
MVLDRSRSIITVESYWVRLLCAFESTMPETLTGVDQRLSWNYITNCCPDWYMFNLRLPFLLKILSFVFLMVGPARNLR